MQAAHTPNRKGKPSSTHGDISEKFGFITADHFVTKDELDQSIDGDKAGIVIKCRGSKWIDLYATKGKNSSEAEAAFADFEGPWKTIEYFYSDDAPELLSAARARGWTQGTATPGRPETNGAAENAVRQVLEGTRTALEWPFAGKHYCTATNITKVDGKCAYDIRHPNATFTGARLPFGCLIDFKPSPVKEKIVSKFEPRSVPGLFIGWILQPGGKFKGDYLVISLEDMKSLLQKPKNARIFVQRIKEIYHNEDEGFIFPLKKQYDENRRNLNVSTPHAAQPRADGDDDGSITSNESSPTSSDIRDNFESPI
jgi:hypothetical protein